MLQATAIKVNNIGKKYRKGKMGYLTLRDMLMNGAKSLFRYQGQGEEFWALRRISFELKKGEVLGIIGKNGSGKSTLLKILARITEPTEGEVHMWGRVASMLEVGTGFNPELTGRENIFLNGAILGMSRQEVSAKYREIVEFSGISQFIDTPVKHYSSGMHMRLAFAVAAHLDAEILLVDEVLAVGDVEFQRKCLGKMSQITRDGRTIIFVSHDIQSIRNLCTRCIYLEKGSIVKEGDTAKVLDAYINKSVSRGDKQLINTTQRTGSGELLFTHCEVKNPAGQKVKKGDSLIIKMRVKNTLRQKYTCRLALSIRSLEERPILSCDSLITGKSYVVSATPTSEITCTIEHPPLSPGRYLLNLAIFRMDQPIDWIQSALEFEVTSTPYKDHVVDVPFPIYADFNWKVT